MTRIDDGLCALDLARREPHPDSARSISISLKATAAGEQIMHKAAGRRIQVTSAALEALPAAERARLHSAAPSARPSSAEVARALGNSGPCEPATDEGPR